MTTRYGRNVLQDLADLSGHEVPEMSMDRLASRYAPAVEEQKARDAERAKEFRLNIPHVVQVQNRIAERLATEAREVNGKLPVASVYEAYRQVHDHENLEADPGLRALHGHLERMWKKNRTASITANLYLTLHDHYARNFPKSAAAQVIVEIGKNGYTTLPLSDLTHIASTIESQEDFDREVVYHGLNGPLPHQVKARQFILALLNADEDEGNYNLEGMEMSPPFVGEEGDEQTDSFVPPRSAPMDKVKTRGPKAQTEQSSDEADVEASEEEEVEDAEMNHEASTEIPSWKKALREEMSGRTADWQVNEEVMQSIGESAGNMAADLAQGARDLQEAGQDFRDEFSYLGYESMTDEDWEDVAEYFMSMGPGDRTPEDQDYVLSPAGTLGGLNEVSQFGGRTLGTFQEIDEAFEAIREKGNQEQFWPNVWYLSDHGNWGLVEDFDWTAPPSKPSGGDWDFE